MLVRTALPVLSVLALLLVLPLEAAPATSCRWEWACDEGGDCVQVPACHSTWELTPPPRPPTIEPPIVAPRIGPPAIPPVATRCEQVRRCTPHECKWETVCE